jgi:DNA-binding response OmpR family regulator
MPLQRILYVGHDLSLLGFLHDNLAGCFVVRAPGGSETRLFLESEIDYALLLIDEQLPGLTGQALARFARSLPHRLHTPIIILTAGDARYADGLFFERPGEANLLLRVVKSLLVSPS